MFQVSRLPCSQVPTFLISTGLQAYGFSPESTICKSIRKQVPKGSMSQVSRSPRPDLCGFFRVSWVFTAFPSYWVFPKASGLWVFLKSSTPVFKLLPTRVPGILGLPGYTLLWLRDSKSHLVHGFSPFLFLRASINPQVSCVFLG